MIMRFVGGSAARVVAPTASGLAPLSHFRAAPKLAATSQRRARFSSSAAAAALKVGDRLPSEVKLSYFDGEGTLKTETVGSLTAGRRAVLVGVPGAFTPTCSLKHVPSFLDHSEELREAGVDLLGVVSVNDAFVMRAWGESLGADGKALFLGDGSGDFARAAGIELDLSDKGLGSRLRRFALLADDGVVELLNIEEGGAYTISDAENLLSQIKKR